MRYACALGALLIALIVPATVRAAGGGGAAYVVDARLAVLRAGPSLDATAERRLRVGRRLIPVGRKRDGEGRSWLRVAVTRRTRGWMLADATAIPGDRAGERRLSERVAAAGGIERAELARLAMDKFARLRNEAKAAMAEAAADAADALTRRARRRLGEIDGASDPEVRALMLSDPAVDRWNRLGVRFVVDSTSRRFLYPTPASAPGHARNERSILKP